MSFWSQRGPWSRILAVPLHFNTAILGNSWTPQGFPASGHVSRRREHITALLRPFPLSPHGVRNFLSRRKQKKESFQNLTESCIIIRHCLAILFKRKPQRALQRQLLHFGEGRVTDQEHLGLVSSPRLPRHVHDLENGDGGGEELSWLPGYLPAPPPSTSTATLSSSCLPWVLKHFATRGFCGWVEG